ncbi:MAG: PKD domain-containing protein [Saprospiraceae bacterium]|nr:PKD domain-containing protein [Saprospiraceae bacterium]
MENLKSVARNQSLIKGLLAVFFMVFWTVSALAQISIQQNATSCFGPGCPSGGKHTNQFRFAVKSTDPDFNPGHYSYFWFFGDGTFSNSQTPIHTFPSADTYQVYVELTSEVYDDEPPPARIIMNPFTLTSISTTAASIPPVGSNTLIELFWSRDPRPGDPVTYVLKLENNCTTADNLSFQVYFEYDQRFLNQAAIIPPTPFTTFSSPAVSNPTTSFPAPTSPPAGWVSGQTITRLTWDVNLAPNQTENIFIPFETVNNPNLIGEPVYILAGIPKEVSTQCGSPESIKSGQYMVYSHDPNQDLANVDTICPNAPPATIKYRIDFQNTGAAPADSVEVTVWLDEIFTPGAVNFIGSKYPASSGIGLDVTQNTYTRTFENLNLRGTKESGYRSVFQEAATKGYMEIELPINGPLNHCSTILNRASIVFDCNPAIYTLPAITRVACVVVDSFGVDSCVSCKETRLTYDVNTPGQTGGFSFGSAGPIRFPKSYGSPPLTTHDLGDPANYSASNAHIGWPDFWITGNDPGSCKRLLMRSVMEPCSLDVQATITPSGCGFGMSYTADLSVSGGTGPYVWQDCGGSGINDQLTLNNLMPGYHTIGVSDSNDCEGWITFLVPIIQPLHVEDDPSDCFGKLKISGGAPPYTVQWSGSSVTDPATVIVLSSLPAGPVSVTVTDAMGCFEVITVGKSNCVAIGWPWWSWLVLGGISLVIVGFLLVKLKKKP